MISQSVATQTQRTNPLRGLFRPEILLPLLVVFGYIAFVITGFGAGLGSAQPLPIYLYASLLLILLQLYLSSYRSLLRSLYGIAAAIFGLVFASGASFFPNTPGNFTRAPLTYVIVNIISVIVFASEAWHRLANKDDVNHIASQSTALRVYRTLAANFAGLAILFGLSAFLLDFMNTRSALRLLHIPALDKPLVVDLNHLFGFALPTTIRHLEGLNLALAFVMAAIWLLLIVIIGALTGVGTPNAENTNRFQQQGPAFAALLRAFRDIFARGFAEATYSLRSVLQIFLWLIPAFSIANFAGVSSGYFNAAARTQVGIVDLFNPLSASSLSNVGRGFADLLLAMVALLAVAITVVVAEFDTAIITNTLRQMGAFVRVITLTLVFFTLSLAVTNAATKLFSIDQATPFQVGAATGVALLLFAGNALVTSFTDRPKAGATTAN